MRLLFGEFALDRGTRQLLRNGEELHLEPKALDLLELLLGRSPEAVPKREIRDCLWPNTFVSDSSLTGLVGQIRQILGDDPKQPRFIRTVYGFGYAFLGPLPTEDPVARGEEGAQPMRAVLQRRPSVAVLPFKNLGGEPEAAHMGLGLADATITELSLVKSLLVRSTTAILRYEGRTLNREQAGRELAVDAVVDGSFQRSGSRLRITVQLIAVADGRSLWGAKIDTSLEDIFQTQDEVSRRIAEALGVELAEESRWTRTSEASGAAYDLFLKGRVHLLHESHAEVQAALRAFEQACRIDPSYAPAWAGVSEAYARIAYSFEPEGDAYEKAETSCEMALSLDPLLVEGHFLRGRLFWSPRQGFDHLGALREFKAAVRASPGLSEAHRWLGKVLSHIGLIDEAVCELEEALAINPESQSVHLAFCCYLQGRYEEALEISTEAFRRTQYHWALRQMGLCQLQLGRVDEAEQTVEAMSLQSPGNVLSYPVHGLVAASRGDRHSAHEQVELIVQNRKAFGHYHHAQYDVACIYALLGDREQALGWLTQAAKGGFPCYPFFWRDSFLASIRGDEAFDRLIAELESECRPYRRLFADLQTEGR